MTEREKLAAELSGLLDDLDAVCEHGLDGTSIVEKLAYFLQEHGRFVLAALRADSDAAVERAAAAIGDCGHIDAYGEFILNSPTSPVDLACAALRAALEPQR